MSTAVLAPDTALLARVFGAYAAQAFAPEKGRDALRTFALAMQHPSARVGPRFAKDHLEMAIQGRQMGAPPAPFAKETPTPSRGSERTSSTGEPKPDGGVGAFFEKGPVGDQQQGSNQGSGGDDPSSQGSQFIRTLANATDEQIEEAVKHLGQPPAAGTPPPEALKQASTVARPDQASMALIRGEVHASFDKGVSRVTPDGFFPDPTKPMIKADKYTSFAGLKPLVIDAKSDPAPKAWMDQIKGGFASAQPNAKAGGTQQPMPGRVQFYLKA